MSIEKFEDLKGTSLIVKTTRKSIILETETLSKGYNVSYNFTQEALKSLICHLEGVAHNLWKDFTPKEATCLRNDYFEYYDKELDSNGCLIIKENEIILEKPAIDNLRLYEFKKGKMESFVYDLKKQIDMK